MTEKKRMVSNEQHEFINILGCVSQLALTDSIEKRIKSIPRGWFRYKGALTNLATLINDLTMSMPEKQMLHIKKQLPAIKMTVGVKAQMPRDHDAEYGRWLSFNDLNVVATAIRECCRTCAIEDPQEQKKCVYCKLLDVLPTDKPDENSNGCGYFYIWM